MIKAVNEKIKNEAKDQKGGFGSMVLTALCDRLLGNILASKVMEAEITTREIIRAGERTAREV